MKIRWILLLLAGLGMTYYGLTVPDASLFRDPTQARIVFFHVPCAFTASILFVVAAVAGIVFLRSKSEKSAELLHAGLELGTVTAVLTLLTGILFSQAQWGTWWHNDPRQTSFLIVCLAYVAALAVRSGFADRFRRDRAAAAYAIASILPAIFLIFVYPRLPQVAAQSFHPTNTIPEGSLDLAYKIGVWGTLSVVAWACTELAALRVQAGLAERAAEKKNYEPDRTDPTGSGVVRPVAVPRQDD